MSRDSPTTAGADLERSNVDTLLTILADEQRRQVLRYFQRSDDPVASVEALVDSLVESECPPARKRAAIRLHHVSLPKLAAAGVIEYDARSHTIRYRASPRWEQALTNLTEQEAVAYSSGASTET